MKRRKTHVDIVITRYIILCIFVFRSYFLLRVLVIGPTQSVLRISTWNILLTCVSSPESGSFQNKTCFPSYGKCVTIVASSKACDWSGHIFGASASPRSLTTKLATTRSSTVFGGQHETKSVAFELLSHAAYVADEIRGFPARRPIGHLVNQSDRWRWVFGLKRVLYFCQFSRYLLGAFIKGAL